MAKRPPKYPDGPGFTKGSATSESAAVSAASNAKSQKARIRELLSTAGIRGLTPGDLYDLMNGHLDLTDAKQARKRIPYATITGRLAPMKVKMEVVETGAVRLNRTGEGAGVVVLANFATPLMIARQQERMNVKKELAAFRNAVDALPSADRMSAVRHCIRYVKGKAGRS